MLSIKNNMMAEVAARNLNGAYDSLATSVARLSSGLRINSAKDDAAGLAVRELIRADIAALRQGSRNAADGISMLQTAEGALGAVDDILIRMEELAEQASTESYSTAQRSIMQSEFQELSAEIDRIVGNTAFNGVNLLNNTTSYNIHVGTSEMISVAASDMTASALEVKGSLEFITGRGVSAVGDTYFEGTGADEEIGFTFDSATTLGGVSYQISANTGVIATLQEVVDLLNVSSDALVTGWEAASAIYDGGSGQYVLKLENYMNGDLQAGEITVDSSMGTVDVEWATNLGGDAVALTAFARTDGTALADLSTAASARLALAKVKIAIETKDTARAGFGYKMNRLEAAISVIDIQAENLAVAEGRISDADVATEMAAMTRTQVLAQAGISMLAQANSIPQMALTLLR